MRSTLTTTIRFRDGEPDGNLAVHPSPEQQRVAALQGRECGHTSPVALPLPLVLVTAALSCATFHVMKFTPA